MFFGRMTLVFGVLLAFSILSGFLLLLKVMWYGGIGEKENYDTQIITTFCPCFNPVLRDVYPENFIPDTLKILNNTNDEKLELICVKICKSQRDLLRKNMLEAQK